MENHGLGGHNDKICAKSLTGNTPTIYSSYLSNRPTILDIFEKSPNHMSIVHGCTIDDSKNLLLDTV